MFEVLSFIFGGVFRLIPEAMKLWDKQKDRLHELAMLDKQIAVDEARAKTELQKMETAGKIELSVEELKSMVAASQAQLVASEKTGYWFLDTLLVLADVASKFVRPVLTYWFCVVSYGAYKVAGYTTIYKAGVKWDQALQAMFTETDYQVMLSIIGFWFVDRAMRYKSQ
jgi:hypothetical protein